MSKRVFVGIPISYKLVQACSRLQQAFKGVRTIRWMPEENLHITVLFIGEVEEVKIPELMQLFSEISSNTKPFELELGRYTYFPEAKPRMIWAQFKANESFVLLAAETRRALGHLCADKQEKEAIPHVTLARFKYLPAQSRKALLPSPPMQLKVDAVNLYESFLSSSGARYEVVESFSLRG